MMGRVNEGQSKTDGLWTLNFYLVKVPQRDTNTTLEGGKILPVLAEQESNRKELLQIMPGFLMWEV